MTGYFYDILLGLYGILLVLSLLYYFSRRAPTGDASVGWAIGIFYTAGLAGIIAVAWFLRKQPGLGLIVLGFPLVFLVFPTMRRVWTDLYVRFPSFDNTPLLILFIENHTALKLHIKLECWFGKAKSQSASLYTTFDYYVAPLEKSSFPLTAEQTRLLAHKSKYVSIMTYEQVTEEYEDRTYIKDIQPCMQFYEEKIEAFRAGKYTIVIDPE